MNVRLTRAKTEERASTTMEDISAFVAEASLDTTVKEVCSFKHVSRRTQITRHTNNADKDIYNNNSYFFVDSDNTRISQYCSEKY